MTPRDRVLTVLNHEEADRVPFFLGASGATTMLTPLYEKVQSHFGIHSPIEFLHQASQQVKVDPRIRRLLGADGQPIAPGPPPAPLAKKISDDMFVDAMGITWRKAPNSIYFEIHESPLRHATIDDLDRYQWPDVANPARFTNLRAEAKALHDQGEAVLLYTGVGIFTPACETRSVEQVLLDLAADPEFITALLTKLEGLAVDCLTAALRECGEYVDIVITGDDVASQAGPMMSPAMYRRLIKPHHARMFAAIRENTKAKIYLHSCGNVYKLIGDFIDVGVELLNPIQVSAGDMGDTARLKREFGDRLSFLGAIDTQRVLPFGTTDDVRAEVRRRLHDLAPGGGYIASAVHCLQPDVPLENVLAMCDEIVKAGRYPLSV
jgi:uroporphyrinogen decarboxylase